MNYPLLLASITLIGCASAHAALYRCEVNGKPVYQDRACADAKSGAAVVLSHPSAKSAAPAPIQDSAPNGAKPTPQQITDEWMARTAREQAERERQRKISALSRERESLVKAMGAELAALRVKKTAANNNLAGATYEQSISTEMQAIATAYDARIRAKDEELKILRENPVHP